MAEEIDGARPCASATSIVFSNRHRSPSSAPPIASAGRNWSNRPTPTGLPLAALALLWEAGRVHVLTPFGWAAAIVNAAFPLAAAAALAVPFWASRNRRNYFFVGLPVLMG